jgi:hypothetical protein
MIIGEINTGLKRLTGRLKLCFLGDFIETKAKKSPGLVSPESFSHGLIAPGPGLYINIFFNLSLRTTN